MFSDAMTSVCCAISHPVRQAPLQVEHGVPIGGDTAHYDQHGDDVHAQPSLHHVRGAHLTALGFKNNSVGCRRHGEHEGTTTSEGGRKHPV